MRPIWFPSLPIARQLAACLIFALIALVGGVAVAQVTTVGGKTAPGSATVPLKVAADGSVVTTVGTGGAAKPMAPAAGAPAARVTISTVNAAATGLTAGATYRVACSTDCYYRVGSGTPTAVTTDSAFFGPGVEYMTLPAGSTAIAFITYAGAGFCTITALTAP